MQLTQKDVEAIAKSRVSFQESKKTNQVTIGVVVVLIIGFFVASNYSYYVGIGLMAVSIVAYLYYSRTLKTKQDSAKWQLLAEWDKENSGKVVK